MQGMVIIRYALPPVPEDREIRAQNWARNEEQHRRKKEKKKKAKKVRKTEASAKRRCEAEKAGLTELESSEASTSEVEGKEEGSHCLNELADEEEDEEIPLLVGGRRPQGGLRLQGAQGSPPTLSLMTRRTGPCEGARFPHISKRGSWRRAEGMRCPRGRRCQKAQLSLAQQQGQRQRVRWRRRGMEQPSEPLRPLERRRALAR